MSSRSAQPVSQPADKAWMRTYLVGFMSVWLACTRPNPDVCCTTQEQCDALSIDDLRPCDASRVCTADGACVAPQCTVDADCMDAGVPICSAQVCVAKCTDDGECTDSSAPHCDEAGACVACTADAQCTGPDAPVCDSDLHACRSCAKDSECSSGVCIEETGQCADEAQLLFVIDSGSDNAQCSRSEPCKTGCP
jgi:hypothetical protein